MLTRQQTITGSPETCSLSPTKHFKGKLEGLKQQDIKIPLGMDERAEWCKAFIKMQWKSQAMPRFSNTKPSTYMTSP